MAAASNAGPAVDNRFSLHQAQRMQTVGRMAGGVTHDFANLITIIAGYSETLLNRLPMDDPSRVELTEIRRAAERGAHLTARLLGFARGETARLQRLT